MVAQQDSILEVEADIGKDSAPTAPGRISLEAVIAPDQIIDANPATQVASGIGDEIQCRLSVSRAVGEDTATVVGGLVAAVFATQDVDIAAVGGATAAPCPTAISGEDGVREPDRIGGFQPATVAVCQHLVALEETINDVGGFSRPDAATVARAGSVRLEHGASQADLGVGIQDRRHRRRNCR